MSELTTCNYCNLRRIKDRAKKEKKKVTKIPTSQELGGFEIFVHPKEIDIKKLSKKERTKYFSSWMWEITDHCVY